MKKEIIKISIKAIKLGNYKQSIVSYKQAIGRLKREGKMKIFPRSIKELSEITTMRIIRSLVVDEMDCCMNIYAPKYKELNKLYNWVSENIPDKRIH